MFTFENPEADRRFEAAHTVGEAQELRFGPVNPTQQVIELRVGGVVVRYTMSNQEAHALAQTIWRKVPYAKKGV